MVTRIALTLALLATVALAPWITEMIITLGKPVTVLVLAPVGFTLGTSAVATVLERNAR